MIVSRITTDIRIMTCDDQRDFVVLQFVRCFAGLGGVFCVVRTCHDRLLLTQL